LPPRPVHIAALQLIAVPHHDHADCEAMVGKGTYVRALARDLAIALGTVGHVVELRRLTVGPFNESQAISLDSIAVSGHNLFDSEHLLPIEIALGNIPAMALTGAEAARLRCGQRVTLEDVGERERLHHLDQGTVVAAWHAQALIALARVHNGGLRPARVFNR
jgi:tRNA pseudouridine55 synthase